jgi:hypothetical protein
MEEEQLDRLGIGIFATCNRAWDLQQHPFVTEFFNDVPASLWKIMHVLGIRYKDPNLGNLCHNAGNAANMILMATLALKHLNAPQMSAFEQHKRVSPHCIVVRSNVGWRRRWQIRPYRKRHWAGFTADRVNVISEAKDMSAERRSADEKDGDLNEEEQKAMAALRDVERLASEMLEDDDDAARQRWRVAAAVATSKLDDEQRGW